MAAQVNNSNLEIVHELSNKEFEKALTETLYKIESTTSKNRIKTIYTGSDYWWNREIHPNISLYGVKYIKSVENWHLYEAIVFDDFPRDRKCYSILYGDTEEETNPIYISDTCIRFNSINPNIEFYNITLTWSYD